MSVRVLSTENSPLSRLDPHFSVEGTNDYLSSWVRPVIAEFDEHLSSEYLKGISVGIEETTARAYRETLMTSYFNSYCHAANLYPALLQRVDIKNSNATKRRPYEELSVDEQIVFEFMARFDMIAIGLMPLDKYGLIERSEFKDAHERLNIKQSKAVTKLDWLQVFINAQEDNLSPSNHTKGELSTFIPFMIYHTYDNLKRHNIPPKEALKIIICSLPPIYQEERDNYKYWEKILNLRKFQDLIKNDYEKEELETLLSYYPSTREYLQSNR